MKLGALAMLLLAVAGCVATRKEAEPPPGGAEIEALERDLSISERDLEAQLAQRTQDRAEQAESSQPAQKPAEAEPDEDEGRPRRPSESQAPSEPPAPGDAPAAKKSEDSPCDIACRALASMRRSAGRICELTGSASERCTQVRRRVSVAEERVRRAGCECVEEDSEKLNAGALPKGRTRHIVAYCSSDG